MYSAILIDDDVWSLAGIQACFPFADCGFFVEKEFRSAEEALPYIIRKRPNLVITDICMSDGSGLDLIRECRDKNTSSLFVIVSGYEKFSFAQEAIELGALAYLLKPLEQEKARNALQTAYGILVSKQNTSNEKCLFEKLYEYIGTHAIEGLALEQLADEFHISKSYAAEMLRKHFGKSFITIKNERCMEYAGTLLLETQMTVAEISEKIRCDDERYFSRLFRKYYGITPIQYRKSGQNQKKS